MFEKLGIRDSSEFDPAPTVNVKELAFNFKNLLCPTSNKYSLCDAGFFVFVLNGFITSPSR